MKKLFFLLILCLCCISIYVNDLPECLQKSNDFYSAEVSKMSDPLFGVISFFLVFVVSGLVIYVFEKKEKWIARDIYVFWGATSILFLIFTITDIKTVIITGIFFGLMITGMATGSIIGRIIYRKEIKSQKIKDQIKKNGEENLSQLGDYTEG